MTQTQETPIEQLSLLEQARAEADRLGIKYHHRAKAETVLGLIASHDAQLEVEDTPAVTPASRVDSPGVLITDPLAQTVVPMTAEEYRVGRVANDKRKVASLIRCRIQCMNPAKKEWPGEIFSVGSAKLGTFKKFIPFSQEPWHIPKIMYDMLMEKKCSVFHTSRDERGNQVRKSRLINEFAIEVLEPLTPLELSELGRQQALAAGQG